MTKIFVRLAVVAFGLVPLVSRAEQTELTLDLTNHWVGSVALLIFVLAYGFVIVEEFTHLRKSKPVMLAAGIIWAIIALSICYRVHTACSSRLPFDIS